MTQNKDKIICIFGGSGFLGRYIVQDLARAGFRIKVATRYPESAYALKTYGDVGQVVPVFCDYKDEASIKAAMTSSYAVINLVGILFEKGKNSFMRMHRDLPATLSSLANELKIENFIHVSALGVETSRSKYAKSKLAGEEALVENYKDATILRPSVVFGPGDSFFNMFAKLATFLPAFPLIGGGTTKFQPVYVGDIAQSIANILTEKTSHVQGKIYELAGPEVVTFKEIYQILFKEIDRDRMLVSIPWLVAKIQGSVMSLLPKPMLTRDQVTSLQTDNVKNEGSLGLQELGVMPTAMGTILPRYLSNFKKGGRFANKKSA